MKINKLRAELLISGYYLNMQFFLQKSTRISHPEQSEESKYFLPDNSN